MDAIGNRSTMLILREAWYGTTRFDDFAARAGVTDAVAAARLRRLVELGVLAKRPYREPGRRTRDEYVLTGAGRELVPVLIALMQWGDRHLQRDGGPLDVVDDDTGEPVTLVPATASGVVKDVDGLAMTVNRAWRGAADPPG